MLHEEAHHISYKYAYILRKVLNQILGLYSIDHMSINIQNPENEMIFFSSTPAHAYEICKAGFGSYDGIITPQNFINKSHYWWDDVNHLKFSDEINAIRKRKMKMHDGFVIHHEEDGHHILISCASRSKKNCSDIFTSNVNEIYQLGIDCYNELIDIYKIYSINHPPPRIQKIIKINPDLIKPHKEIII
ncbi:hypothetical protein [Piscirickettsia litoralis]|uniref:Uncharacterized protein n=1 Tax=Piscirickettsia litoralis TaxID=1891921 RepID=A0ABX2ZZQ6_9GAMM|nr:hypothetical protein [Piscirickettsia litoralis]ODN40941.1 hypothetical protein BGC07_18945 [Piscirickettsia litoralis]